MSRRRVLRTGFVILAIGFLCYALASQWDKTVDALSQLSVWSVAAAAIAGILAPGAAMLAWRSLLAGLGSPLPVRAAARVMFLGQLGKYIPGSVWQVVATVELARDHAVPRKRSFTATLFQMAVTLACGLGLAGIMLPLTSADAARRYWWVLALAPTFLVLLHPAVLTWLLNLMLRVLRREPLVERLPAAAMGRAVGWVLLGWLLLAVQCWFLVRDVHGGGFSDFVPAAGAYLLAWSVGFLTIFAPGGIGSRELALVAGLAPLMSRPEALVIATVLRLISTAGDLAWAGLAATLRPRAEVRR